MDRAKNISEDKIKYSNAVRFSCSNLSFKIENSHEKISLEQEVSLADLLMKGNHSIDSNFKQTTLVSTTAALNFKLNDVINFMWRDSREVRCVVHTPMIESSIPMLPFREAVSVRMVPYLTKASG